MGGTVLSRERWKKIKAVYNYMQKVAVTGIYTISPPRF
jgi:hypothetical protein